MRHLTNGIAFIVLIFLCANSYAQPPSNPGQPDVPGQGRGLENRPLFQAGNPPATPGNRTNFENLPSREQLDPNEFKTLDLPPNANENANENANKFRSDQLLVRFFEGTSESEIEDFEDEYELERLDVISIVGLYLYKLPSGLPPPAALQQLKRDSVVKEVTYNYILELDEPI